jgi:hypothetical protein
MSGLRPDRAVRRRLVAPGLASVAAVETPSAVRPPSARLVRLGPRDDDGRRAGRRRRGRCQRASRCGALGGIAGMAGSAGAAGGIDAGTAGTSDGNGGVGGMAGGAGGGAAGSENTGADCPVPAMPAFEALPSIPALPDPKAGAMIAWAWGISRIIDGLTRTASMNRIDVSRLAVTGWRRSGVARLVDHDRSRGPRARPG